MHRFDRTLYWMEARSLSRVLAFAILCNAGSAFAQCGITGNASISLYCNSGFVYELQDVHWSGGTPPYSGFVEFGGYGAGSFTDEYGNGWSDHHPVGVPEGQQQCGYSQLFITDAEGCEFNYSAWECIYWLNPANQFIVSAVVWDDVAGTATVTLIDNPNDVGDVLQNHYLEYGLYRTDIQDPGTIGELGDIYQASPPRLVLSGLVPGQYSMWIDPGPPLTPPIYCQGVAISFAVVDPSPNVVSISPRMFLGGAGTTGGLMPDALRTGGLIPLAEPYVASGYTYTGTHGPTSTTQAVLNTTGASAIVDWVAVELRGTQAPYSVVASRPALLQRDGDVVAPDGTSSLTFNMPGASYPVAVRHRNHLGVMTGTSTILAATPVTVDLTSAGTSTYGSNARMNSAGTMMLWPGNVTVDGVIRYVGANNDRDPILQAIGGSTPTNTMSNVYNPRDVNMDGIIRYVGANNDRDVILQTVGGSVPTATRSAQLP